MNRREFTVAVGSAVVASAGNKVLAGPGFDDPIEVDAELLEEDVVVKFLRHRCSALLRRIHPKLRNGMTDNDLVGFLRDFQLGLEVRDDGRMYVTWIAVVNLRKDEAYGSVPLNINDEALVMMRSNTVFEGRELLTVAPIDIEPDDPKGRR